MHHCGYSSMSIHLVINYAFQRRRGRKVQRKWGEGGTKQSRAVPNISFGTWKVFHKWWLTVQRYLEDLLFMNNFLHPFIPLKDIWSVFLLVSYQISILRLILINDALWRKKNPLPQFWNHLKLSHVVWVRTSKSLCSAVICVKKKNVYAVKMCRLNDVYNYHNRIQSLFNSSCLP